VSTGPESDLCPGCAAPPEETGEVAGVLVYTARISSRDPDVFDITAKSGGVEGAPFAPSWEILRPALAARTQALTLIAEAKREPQHRIFHEGRALEIEDAAWAVYQPAYRLEMRTSYKANRAAWDQLLARRRVVLVCYCTDEKRCHRRLLAGYLAKLGAVDQGELVAEVRQVELF
jgi:hypothetical protein